MSDSQSNSNNLNQADRISLWPSVHDGELLGLASNLFDRTIAITVRVLYLNSFHRLSESTSFTFFLRGVQEVGAKRHTSWPKPFEVAPGTRYELQSKLRTEWYAKGRLESVSWSEIEALGNALDDFEISDGSIVIHDTGRSVLFLEIFSQEANDYLYLEFTYHELEILQTNGPPISLSAFILLGNEYWNAFAKGRLPE